MFIFKLKYFGQFTGNIRYFRHACVNTRLKIAIFVSMTIEELKAELLGKSFPERVEISVDQVVFDVDLFLRIQFIQVESWKKDITKCPAYIRLMRFREAVNTLQ